MSMNLGKAIEIVNSQEDIEAYIIYLNGKGEEQEFMSKGFKELLVK